jgi:hypothetical protein
MFPWLHRLDQHIPLRYTAWLTCTAAAVAAAASWLTDGRGAWLALGFGALTAVGLRDTRQTRHAVLRNYPVIGHLRFLLEYVRPELRQYFLESDTEATPFSRQQRSLVYQRAKGDPDKRPFGTQRDVGATGYEWINHSLVPTRLATHDFRVLIGAERARPYDASVFNISAMSFGALSANAILALNTGARRGNFAHDTGEGSISRYHLEPGGDLIWEIGSGYFGCRNPDGSFSEERFVANATLEQVRMIELKLSQGAKPGHGGVLPGSKVTPEIAAARGVPVGAECISPASHSAFSTPIGRQAHGFQAVRGASMGMVRDRASHGGDRHPAGLHRRRWCGGWHGRRAARVQRSRRCATAGRPDAGAQYAGRARSARSRAHRLRGQGRECLRHRAHVRARRRLV